MSNASSIDAFLGRRPDFMEVGKLAIAACLLPSEDLNALCPIVIGGDHWYSYLGARMDADPDKLLNNRVSFVTFNYDRSLEMYFFLRWKNLYSLTDEQSWDLVRQLKIVHVYGKLGSLFPGSVNFVPYGGANDVGHYLRAAAKELKLIDDTERHQDSEEFSEARELIRKSKVLCFLGFGFDKTNVQRLGGDKIAAANMDGPIYVREFAASALGLKKLERQNISKLIHPPEGTQLIEAKMYDLTCLETLRESQVLGYCP